MLCAFGCSGGFCRACGGTCGFRVGLTVFGLVLEFRVFPQALSLPTPEHISLSEYYSSRALQYNIHEVIGIESMIVGGSGDQITHRGFSKPRSLSPNPKPRTPNPEPRTPNPEPRTPNPEPRTPNPEPPNPKPQTPNPDPRTLNLNPRP